jgi:hypothetical protein
MRYAALGLLLTLPLLAGCAPGTGKVSGQVTYKNKPVPGGLVTFRPVDGKYNSVTVELDENGWFRDVELPAGEVLVSIDNRQLEPRPTFSGGVPPGIPLSPEARSKLGGSKAAAPPAPAGDGPPQTGEDMRRPSGRYVPIPEKYYEAETSGLKITVKGKEQTETFELVD